MPLVFIKILSRRTNLVQDPAGRLANLVINARLFVHSATKSSASYAYQGPSPIIMYYEWTTRIPKASIHFPQLMAGTEHFRVKLNKNILAFMPLYALFVLDDGHKDLMKNIGASLAERIISLAPSCHHPNLATKGNVPGGQADGDDVVLVEDWPVKVKESNIKPVWLGQHVSKIWMNSNVINFVSF